MVSSCRCPPATPTVPEHASMGTWKHWNGCLCVWESATAHNIGSVLLGADNSLNLKYPCRGRERGGRGGERGKGKREREREKERGGENGRKEGEIYTGHVHVCVHCIRTCTTGKALFEICTHTFAYHL